MDRSKVSRLTVAYDIFRCAPLVLMLVLLLGSAATVCAEDPEATESAENAAAGDTAEKEKEAKEPNYSAGLFFGHILSINPDRSVFIKPSDRASARKTFYFDAKSRFSKFVEGKKKRAKPFELIEGSKAAVRFFADGGFAIADEVFLVEGEFKPELYSSRRKGSKKKGADGDSTSAASHSAPKSASHDEEE
jgi:hypothetical protein